MNYKKLYEEALERARELYQSLINEGTLSTPKGIEKIFPELCESEDEKIRKALIQHIKDKVFVISGWRKEELISWLEKQGEKSWSKEDEITLNNILSCVEYCRTEDIEARYNGNHNVDPKRCEPMIDWLKSLKPQNRWKPSEEQMQALETAIRCRTMPWEQLGTLYNDLKKL